MDERKRRLRVGDWVEVRSKEEILRSLDRNGEYEGMPFMPEMLSFCGQQFKVYKRAHKTCDTVFPVRGRRVPGSVHLETRCDGESHGGCQAGCLIFWKEAWLRRLTAANANEALRRSAEEQAHTGQATPRFSERDLHRCTVRKSDAGVEDVYVCQATRLPYATTHLWWWDARQYVEDYTSGNVTLLRLLTGFTFAAYSTVLNAGIGLGPPLRWIYNRLRPLWHGSMYPGMTGWIAAGSKTPSASLDLRPGEWVRVKRHEEILATLDIRSKNKGLLWDKEMVPYCGGTYRVLRRVTRIIDEKTGLMRDMKSPCIVLDKVICTGRYSKRRLFCPRSISPYFREIWLERVSEPELPVSAVPCCTAKDGDRWDAGDVTMRR